MAFFDSLYINTKKQWGAIRMDMKLLRERYSKNLLGKSITVFDVTEHEYRGKLTDWLEDGTLIFDGLDIVIGHNQESCDIVGHSGMIIFNGDYVKYICLDG